MKGLQLARADFVAHIDQLLALVPEAEGRIAAGLVGEGSQCFGFDDVISQDHDFGPGFCIWLDDEDYERFGDKLQKAYDALPESFGGFSRKNFLAADRLGVMRISDFYRRFTGSASGVPETMMDWLFTPEFQLAAATNGEVFRDDTGLFSGIRQELLGFYPEDIRRKKIAARAAVMAQAGQYNLLRCIQRGDKIAALQALGRFTEAGISMVYLLRRRYTPFYKWSFHGLCIEENDELAVQVCPLFARLAEVAGLLSGMVAGGGCSSAAGEQLAEVAGLLAEVAGAAENGVAYDLAFQLTEEICGVIIEELRRQKLSSQSGGFLQDHLPDIMAGIQDPQIRRLPPMVDCQN